MIGLPGLGRGLVGGHTTDVRSISYNSQTTDKCQVAGLGLTHRALHTRPAGNLRTADQLVSMLRLATVWATVVRMAAKASRTKRRSTGRAKGRSQRVEDVVDRRGEAAVDAVGETGQAAGLVGPTAAIDEDLPGSLRRGSLAGLGVIGHRRLLVCDLRGCPYPPWHQGGSPLSSPKNVMIRANNLFREWTFLGRSGLMADEPVRGPSIPGETLGSHQISRRQSGVTHY